MLRAKIDELDLETHRIAQKFPKAERHVLGAEMRRILNDIIRLEERASRMQLLERKHGQRPLKTWELLQTLDAELGLFKRQIEKAERLGYLKSQGKNVHSSWAGLAREVGSLLGGWLGSVEKACQFARPDGRKQGSLI